MPKKRSTARGSSRSRRTPAGRYNDQIEFEFAQRRERRKKQRLRRQQYETHYASVKNLAVPKRILASLGVKLHPTGSPNYAKRKTTAQQSDSHRRDSGKRTVLHLSNNRRLRDDCVKKHKTRVQRRGAILAGGSGGGHAPRGVKKDTTC